MRDGVGEGLGANVEHETSRPTRKAAQAKWEKVLLGGVTKGRFRRRWTVRNRLGRGLQLTDATLQLVRASRELEQACKASQIVSEYKSSSAASAEEGARGARGRLLPLARLIAD